MSQGDYELLTAVEDAGGRFVLDATEAGERTLPAPVDIDRLKRIRGKSSCGSTSTASPMSSNAPTIDCSPGSARRSPSGACGESSSGVTSGATTGTARCRGSGRNCRAVLEWDGGGNDPRSWAGALGRMEAFLEMLR